MTKTKLTLRIYHKQRYSSNKRGHAMPTYTLQEFREWLYSQTKFHVLFDNYIRLDKQVEYVPSVDRIDDTLGYTMANIQLVTWDDNNRKHHKDKKQGKNCNQKRGVDKYSKDGDYIESFHSLSEAARVTGANNIIKALKNPSKSSGGFKWKYTHKEDRRDDQHLVPNA